MGWADLRSDLALAYISSDLALAYNREKQVTQLFFRTTSAKVAAMARWFRCSRGHDWELTADQTLSADGTAHCPVCGQAVETHVPSADAPTLVAAEPAAMETLPAAGAVAPRRGGATPVDIP